MLKKAILSLATDLACSLPLTCGSPVEWLELKASFSLSKLMWFVVQTCNYVLM